MPRCFTSAASFSWLSLLLAALTLTGCQSEEEKINSENSGYQVAGGTSETEETPSTEAGTRRPPSSQSRQEGSGSQSYRVTELDTEQPGTSRIPPELLEMPVGDVEAMLAQFDRITEYNPQIRSEQEAREYVREIMPIRVELAKRIMEIGPPADRYNDVLDGRIDALRILALVEMEGAQEQLDEYLAELAASEDPVLMQRADVAKYQIHLDEILNQQSRDADVLLQELAVILEKYEPSKELYVQLSQTLNYLEGTGFSDEAAQASRMLGQKFQDSDDQQVANEAQQMLAAGILSPLFMKGDRETAASVLAQGQASLASDDLTPASFPFTLLMAQALEQTGHLEEAHTLYAASDELLSQRAELDPQGTHQEMLTRAMARVQSSLTILGQPMEITGELSNGDAFDWSEYKGKVVLVDFWATWCSPCLSQLPSLNNLRVKYEGEGFAVLGVNLDDDPTELTSFLREYPLPWNNVVASSPEERGAANDPNALRYHVDSLPFSLLIDRQGNIALVNPRGEGLEHAIEQLLGTPAGDTTSEAPAAEETAPAETAPVEPAPEEDARNTLPGSQRVWQVAFQGDTVEETEPPAEEAEQPTEQTPPPVAVPPPLEPRPPARYPRLPPSLREIPQESTEAKLDFFDNVQQFQEVIAQQGGNAMTVMQDLLPLRLELGTQLLEEELPEDRQLEVLDFHIETLRFMRLFEMEDTTEKLAALAERLAASENASEAKRAGWIRFLLTADALNGTEEVDPQVVINQLTELLAAQEATLELFHVVQSTPTFLQAKNHETEANQAVELIGEAFLDSSDPEAIHSVVYMVVNHQFPRMLNPGGPKPAALVLRASRALLTVPGLEMQDMQNLLRVVEALEYAGNTEAAHALMTDLQVTLANQPEPAAQELPMHQMMLTYATATEERLAASLEMLGKPLELAGEYLGGGSFDWNDYRGKVVLVNYWSTEDEISLEEVPDVNEVYHDYHGHGLEVLGINLDSDREVVERHLARHPTLWSSVVSSSPEATGLEDPNATRYHVQLPYSVLVDEAGNVIMIQARGGALERKLEELLHIETEGEPAAEEGARREAVEREWFVAFVDDTAEEETEAPTLEEPASEDTVPLDQPAEEEIEAGEGVDVFDNSINPYAPSPGMSKLELLEYLMDMIERPVSIQGRPGFNAGVIATCDELLAQDPSGRAFLLASKTRFKYLHRDANNGDEEAQARIVELAEALSANMPENADEELKNLVAFYLIEARALEVDDLPVAELPTLLADIKLFMEDRELGELHLRLASQTVRAINALPEGEREPYFQDFGGMWAESDDRQLARYGRQIGETTDEAEPAQVGQLLTGTGVAFDGTSLDLADYRGQVLIVDFWATWCGPCIRELPNVEATYRELHEKGLEIVGISIDEDLQALAGFLAEHPLPWPTMAGNEGSGIARQYHVNAIPTMMLINREGEIVAVAHSIDPLKEQAIALLEAPAEEEAAPAEEANPVEEDAEPAAN